MHQFWDYLQSLVDPVQVLREGGFYLLLFVVFAETGLFFGFFLPGDYLLFLAGILAAILGNFVGYWFGRKTGPLLYHRKDSFFFKQRYLRAAEEYYHKQGAFALIMGRFIPIVRTFAPIFAGVVGLDSKKFALIH